MSVPVKSATHSPTSRPMSWKDLNFWKTSTWRNIQEILTLQGSNITPRKKWIFRAFIETPLHKTRVVFLFPEPYCLEGVANGLALSCLPKAQFELWKTPFFFSEILLEARNDVHIKIPKTGDLSSWARQGVLLLNTRLTTVIGHTNGHLGLGWQKLTREVLETLYLSNSKTIFVFFGKDTLPYKEFLPTDAVTFELPLPSVFKNHLETSFAGCRIFSKINQELKKQRHKPIDWNVK